MVRERALVFLAPVVRLFVPVLPRADFEAVFRAVPVLFLAAAPVFVFAVDLDFVDVERLAVERLAVDFFAVERPVVLRPVLVAPAAAAPPSSAGHLPDITRSAASETASAISDPSLVALVITEFAAWLAVSAASIPASLIFLRAAGLALIAAAAAASPAASISLLIATLAILSTVVSFDFDFDDFDDPFRVVDFAIANLPSVVPIDTRSEQQFRCGGEKGPDFGQTGKLKGRSPSVPAGQAS